MSSEQERQDGVNQRLFEKLDDVSRLVSDMRVEVAEMKAELRMRKECPNPGACIELAKRVDEHDRVIQQAKGGWKLIIAATISSGALGALIVQWVMPKH